MRRHLVLSAIGPVAAVASAGVTLTPDNAVFTVFGPATTSLSFMAQPLEGGDLDGDGFDDIVCGISSGGDGLRDRVVVFRGEAGFVSARVNSPELVDLALGASPELTILAAAEDDLLASSVAIGDVNGDAFNDLVLGAPGRTAAGRSFAGVVYVLFGGPALFASPVIDLGVAGAADVTILGAEAFADTGGGGLSPFGGFDARALAVGNLNGDAFGDIAIGAHFGANSGGFGPNGRVYLVFGRAFTSPTTLDLAVSGVSGYSVRITGADDGDEIGTALAIGDLSGDGLDDLVIGNPYFSPTISSFFFGQAMVLRGRASWPATIALASTPADIRIQGTANSDEAGDTVTIGDFNNDGIDDLAVGAPGDDAVTAGGPISGRIHVYLGGPRFTPASATYTVDANRAEMIVEGLSGGGLGGWPSAAADVDGDGFDDLVGAMRDAYSQLGAIAVVRGRTAAQLPLTVDLPGGGHDWLIQGVAHRDTVGTWAGTADLDGDGFAEVLAGSSFRGGDTGGFWVFNVLMPSVTAVRDAMRWR